MPHCWSPELQIVDSGLLSIVNISLRLDKIGGIGSQNNTVIPKEEDLVSLCLDEDRLWMLANSPILKEMENKPSFKLYEGSLSDVNFLLKKKELMMN